MRVAPDFLRFLLLDMLSETRPVDISTMAQLREEDWSTIALMARQHRLGPLLAERIATRGGEWPIGHSTRREWEQSRRHAALRALVNLRALHCTTRVLDMARIPYAVLKGMWLAWHVYEEPALRPVRDIDIIVAKDHALPAYELLMRNGFRPRVPAGAPVELALTSGKHLPGLIIPRTAISVEIHHRLFSPSARADQCALDTQSLLQRRVIVGEDAAGMCCLSATDALLHLIVHAAYEHCFCNGPLVLSDIALLLRVAAIDWARFWAEAEAGGWINGCCLVLGLVERHCAASRIQWGKDAEAPPDAVMMSASLIMMQDNDQRGDVDLLSHFAATRSPLAKFGLVAQRVMPCRHRLAAFTAASPESRRIWLAYPNWLLSRTRALARNLATPSLRAEVPRASLVREYLQ